MQQRQTPSVLFMCTRNACRSQMAEALMRRQFGDLLQVYSAGVAPTQVNPLALRALDEVGTDASDHRSKHVGDLADVHFDLVVTLCDTARQACPVFPGDTKVVHQAYENPDEATGTDDERMEVFRRVRDQLAHDLPLLIERELGITPRQPGR